MTKLRSDSSWTQLSPGQRQTLETWLFDDNLSYSDIADRVRLEFGLPLSNSSIGRLCRRRAADRQAEELADAQAEALQLNGLPVTLASLREAVLKLAAKAALRLATETPHDLSPVLPFIKLLLASEENDLRRSRLRLAQSYFDYATTAASLNELPNLCASLQAIENQTDLTEEQKLDRVHALLFGWNTPRTQPQPQPAPLPPSAPEASTPSPRQSSPVSHQNSPPPAPHSPEFTPIPPENSPKLT